MAKTTNPRFRSPMLATATTSLPAGRWIAEEKLDGWRLIVSVDTLTTGEQYVEAWSRSGNQQALPSHLYKALQHLPQGIYDGEVIVPGGMSTDVADHSKRHKWVYVVFDLLHDDAGELTYMSWAERRSALELAAAAALEEGPVKLMPYVKITTWQDVLSVVDDIWEGGGEGLILKDVKAPYRLGKRTKTFLKVKQCQPALMTILGFAESEGEVMKYGLYGTAVVQDEDGVVVPVKVLDDEVRVRLVAAVEGKTLVSDLHTTRLISGKKVTYWTGHPWVGRKLHIEFQTRTADGSYRHPRWNYLEGE